MTARDLRVRIAQSVAICGLLAVAVLTAWAFVREKPEPPDPSRERAIKVGNWRFKEVCSAGHETELVLGQTHLFVDLQAVGLLKLDDAQEVPEGCPSAPVLARSVSFDHILGSKAQEALFRRHNLPLNHLDIDLWARPITPELDPARIPQNPDSRITVNGLGTIEDISRQRKLSSASSRAYRLQPLAATDAVPPAIFLLCHQRNDAKYLCDTYYLYGELRIKYQSVQENSYVPQELLAVDARVRGWIEEMLHHPDAT